MPEINGYRYLEDDVVGVCSEHGGPLVNELAGLILFDVSPEDLLDYEAGIKQLVFCPKGRHWEVRTPTARI